MTLKARHLYKASLKKDSTIVNNTRENVLFSPLEDFETNSEANKFDSAVIICVDLSNHYAEDTSLLLTKRNFEFENVTTQDVFELIRVMKDNKSHYRYNLKNNTIEKKKE